jgi:hypothetical protein
MAHDDDAREMVARHLLEAIERVRRDVEKVEFWADAVSGFAQPVPDYEPGQVNVWVPREQASALKDSRKQRS